jgi:hypothetical protein
MRGMALLIATAALAGCSMAPSPMPVPVRTVDGQHQLDLVLAGRVPLRPVSCLPSPSASGNDMRIIDENTLSFRYGTEIYIAHTTGCRGLTPNGPYTLVSHQSALTGLCRGDPAQVVESGAGLPISSCLITDITPFVPAPR